MIKIALCADGPAVRDGLPALLKQYQDQRGRELSVTTFPSPADLLDATQRGVRFDVLLLDVLSPGRNGIETAGSIRRFDSGVKIIFLTSSPEFAVQSYAVNAFYYQLDPLGPERFFPLLDSVFEVYDREQGGGLLLRCRSGITRVDPKQIEFCEVNHRTLFIHLASGEILESTGSLDKLGEQLAGRGRFLRLHRSYLVNLDYVQSISYRAVTMSCRMALPVPRGKYDELKSAFFQSASQTGRAESRH